MNQVIIHIGMSKTGTTSIQSTLFWNLPRQSFRCLTLDTFFGNRIMGSAFIVRDSDRRSSYFTAGIPADRWNQTSEESRSYLSQCLKNARHQGWTPILSAETVFRFERNSLENLKRFMQDHGFVTRIVVYVRSPLDHLDSKVQQSIKTGWRLLSDLIRSPYGICQVKLLDQIFGSENVSACYFNPATYPNRCVVTHFFESLGIHLDPAKIFHENESLNRNALGFLHLLNSVGRLKGRNMVSHVQRKIVIGFLQTLKGDALRLHSSVSRDWIKDFESDLPWLEDRLGCSVPLSTVDRTDENSIRSLDELLNFSDGSLDWLASHTGGQPPRDCSEPEVKDWVLKHLQRLNAFRHPIRTAGHVTEHLRLLHHRTKMKAILVA